MKRLSWLLLSVALPLSIVVGQEQKEEQPVKHSSVLMKEKLAHAQRILEGLTTDDLDLVLKNAKILSTYGHLENWFRSGLPQYDAQLRIFRFANDELIRQAEAQNLDGASLAYVQLTLSCVNCHKVVRDQKK